MSAEAGTRGRLRVYLGAAPGVGKTYAMLGEGKRRAERGTDVVVGFCECHGRPHTHEMLEGLEEIPRITREHRGAIFEEMDLDAVLARAPEVALVDELAHSNVPGGRHEKRWQDVEELLDAGIDVITTVNIQHLESVNDVVEKITGVPQRETVPDSVVRAADQIELRDMTAEALRRRLAHGNVYAPDKIDAALGNYFRPGNLNALRELALLWTADRVDDALRSYRDHHRISGTWETRERVVVALTGGPEGDTVIRRAARVAARAGGELLAVHVARADGLVGDSSEHLERQRALVESLGGSFHQVLGDPSTAGTSQALLAFARGKNATQLVLGDSRRSRLAATLGGAGIGTRTIRGSGDIDVHIVTHADAASTRRLQHVGSGVGRRRLVGGFTLAVAGPVLTAFALAPFRDRVNLVSDMLLFLLVTVVVSLVGGMAPALVSAVIGSVLINYFFTPPLHTLTITDANNAIALFVFLATALLVSSVVNAAARRSREATRSAAEARMLAELASASMVEGDPVEALLQRLRETFGLESVTLLEQDQAGWVVRASAGTPCTSSDQADSVVPAGEGRTLALRGPLLRAEDQRLLTAFGAQAGTLLDRHDLARHAAEVDALGAVDKVRTALLAAVGHDLRTPLAAAKASVAGLRSHDVDLSASDQSELLATADESLDRLAALVEDLLDMSRLQAGAMGVHLQPTAVEEVVARVLDDVAPGSATSVLADVPTDLPLVGADAALLERVLVNLVTNAVRHSPADRPPLVTASRLGERVEIRVVDRGPGIPEAQREEVFRAFQRLGDTDSGAGIGLGLALARGLTEGMGGTLEPADTPGGGLTMVVALPVVEAVVAS